MVNAKVRVGSPCSLNGAPKIAERTQKHINDEQLEDNIILSGSFCTGKCKRISVGDTVYTGTTTEGFPDFREKTILPAVEKDKERTV